MEELLEQTNPAEEETLELLGEDAPEEAKENGPEADAPQQETPEEMVVAKYNGREIPMPRAAVETLAKSVGMDADAMVATLQKGMNYDHLYGDVQRMKNAREFAVLDGWAKRSGMTRQQLLDQIETQSEQIALQNQQQALAQRYPSAPPEMLEEIARIRLTQQKQELERRQQEEKEQGERQKRDLWKQFFLENPQITDAAEIPKEVFERVAAGEAPALAFLRLKSQEMEKKLAAYSQNDRNRKAAIGPAGGEASVQDADAFLTGFFGK